MCVLPNPVCILSLPRSGSTVLTSLLDGYRGVVCLPESAFPQFLQHATADELASPAQLAALFIASSFSGTPLGLREAEACIDPDDLAGSLGRLGLAVACEAGRAPEEIRTIVWKTTRIIAANTLPGAMGFRFVVLRRDPVNVFDSQFRVGFGLHNRNPLRFALFRQSYECAFSRLPAGRTFALDYACIPECLPSLLEWLGADGDKRQGGTSTLSSVAQNRPWHSAILSEFKNDDHAKRAKVSRASAALLRIGTAASPFLNPLLIRLRRHYDLEVVRTIRANATKMLKQEGRVSASEAEDNTTQ